MPTATHPASDQAAADVTGHLTRQGVAHTPYRLSDGTHVVVLTDGGRVDDATTAFAAAGLHHAVRQDDDVTYVTGPGVTVVVGTPR